jgi:hypothetical protein
MTSKNNNPKARETELVVQELKGELLIYDLNNNKAYCLNPTSAMIWNLCDGNNSVLDITKQAGKKLKQPVTDELVYLALDQFKADNLLDSNQEIEIKFDGLSRREVIRKVGFASLVALPVISSLVAPTAAMAQSAGAGSPGDGLKESGEDCGSDSECSSGSCEGRCDDSLEPCKGVICSDNQGICRGRSVCSNNRTQNCIFSFECQDAGGNQVGECEFVGTCSGDGSPCSDVGQICGTIDFCSGPNRCA